MVKICKREPRFGVTVADPYETVEGHDGIEGWEGLGPRIKVQGS